MSDLNLKGSWNQLKGKLKQEYSHLTENDLTYAEGKEDELYGRLQEKLGKTKDDLKAMFNKMIAPVAHEARVADEKADDAAGGWKSDNSESNMKRG
jgi:uncharacterized protein YjbJ (UPF0337 family)